MIPPANDGRDAFGPTAAELAAIEDEWPVIAAELAVVHAECHYLQRPNDLTHRALRRAHRALADAQVRAHNQSTASQSTQGDES